jgi:5-(carboxyamino)imidazole ribonucleotide mutase/phosphoribosylaminoimidazole-succinocarboxamide synthase
MGSKADLEHCVKISDACKQYGLDTVLRIASAHKTAEHALAILQKYESDPRPKVYITVAGRSNALSGFTDGAVSAPVIACPPMSESFGGVDVFSSLRMPSGIAPAVVLEPVNAALLAAKILGLVDESVQEQVKASQMRAAQKIMKDDASVQ